MEEKILEVLARLDVIEQKFDRVDRKFDEMDTKFDHKINELKDDLRNEFKQECTRLEKNIDKEIKREVLAQMFRFEEEYGRKINIMFEELTAKNQRDRKLEQDVILLEKRIDKNSAFVFNHENRITALEKAKSEII